jgi:hypothetical protein
MAIALAIAVAKHVLHPQEIGASMGFGKEKVLCSQFNGVLLSSEGEPMRGVRIERVWTWSFTGESAKDEALSDDQGRFRFERVTRSSLFSSIVPHEPEIRQEIKAHAPNGAVVLWGHAKHNYDDNGELRGRPIKVVCGIEKAPPGEVLYYGTCVEAI